MTATPSIPLTLDEAKRLLNEANQRTKAQEEVLQQYLKEIRELQDKLKPLEARDRATKNLVIENKDLRAQLGMYQALIKGWPKGRKLVKQLTRDPYDY